MILASALTLAACSPPPGIEVWSSGSHRGTLTTLERTDEGWLASGGALTLDAYPVRDAGRWRLDLAEGPSLLSAPGPRVGEGYQVGPEGVELGVDDGVSQLAGWLPWPTGE
jgi:hypothetical protein